jgi:hypothetical protein
MAMRSTKFDQSVIAAVKNQVPCDLAGEAGKTSGRRVDRDEERIVPAPDPFFSQVPGTTQRGAHKFIRGSHSFTSKVSQYIFWNKLSYKAFE